MHENCVVAAYDNVKHAREAVHALDSSHFPTEQVSLVVSNLQARPDIESDLQAGDEAGKWTREHAPT